MLLPLLNLCHHLHVLTRLSSHAPQARTTSTGDLPPTPLMPLRQGPFPVDDGRPGRLLVDGRGLAPEPNQGQ